MKNMAATSVFSNDVFHTEFDLTISHFTIMASKARKEKTVKKKNKDAPLLHSPQQSSKLPEASSSTTAEKSDDENAKETTSRSSNNGSPEQNCPICLGKLQNKSFTDSCFHMFCFVCLKEWTKVKAECPLCKQKYSSVLYDVKSYEEYKQMSVKDIQEQGQRWDDHQGHRFRYRTTLTVERRLMMDFPQHMRAHIEHDYTLQRPSRRPQTQVTTRSHWRRQRQMATTEFRRRTYINGLRVREEADQRLRQRNITPEFFSSNPATVHRLVPWLNRELNALLYNHSEQVQWVLDFILELIKSYSINSEQFYQHMYPYIGRHTRHFMHEFEYFARSPYNMAAYDQHAVYEPQIFEVLSADESDSTEDNIENLDNNNNDGDDDNDDDVIIVSPSPQSTDIPEIDLSESNDIPPNQQENNQPLVIVQEESFDGQREPPAERRGASFQDISPILERVRLFLKDTQAAPTLSTSGWDSPTPGPSWMNVDNASASAGRDVESVPLPETPPLLQNIRQEVISDDEKQNSKKKLPVYAPILSELFSSARPIKIEDDSESSVDSDSDSGESSDNSAVVFVGMDKAWDARSPIMLSSESDEEVLKEAVQKLNEHQKKKLKLIDSKKKKHKYSKSYRDKELERHHSRHSRDHGHRNTRHSISSRSRSRERSHSYHKKQRKYDLKKRSRSPRERIHTGSRHCLDSYTPPYYISETAYRHDYELSRYRRRQKSGSDSSECTRQRRGRSKDKHCMSTSSSRNFDRYKQSMYRNSSFDRQQRSRSRSVGVIRNKRSRSNSRGRWRSGRYRSSSEELYTSKNSKSKKKQTKAKKHKKHHKKHKKAAHVISSDSDFDLIAVGPRKVSSVRNSSLDVQPRSTHVSSSSSTSTAQTATAVNTQVDSDIEENVHVEVCDDNDTHMESYDIPADAKTSKGEKSHCVDTGSSKQFKKHPTGHKKGSKQSERTGRDGETTTNNDISSSDIEQLCELETQSNLSDGADIADLGLEEGFSDTKLIDSLAGGHLCLSPISDTSSSD